MDVNIFGERRMTVFCSECKEHHYTDSVKFLNIEEDFYGRDLMTFECYDTSTKQKSNVFS